MVGHLQSRRASKEESFALIIALAMVTLVTVIVIGFLANASLERLTAKSYNNRFRAESAAESGLSAALNALGGATAPTNFQYITSSGADQPVLVPLQYNAATGAATPDIANERRLYSQGPSPATLTLSATANPKITRQAGYVNLMANDASNRPREIERYAFYIDEGASRQNLGVQGGVPRVSARDPAELPILTTASPSPAPFSAAQTSAIVADRALLITPPTANLSLAGAPVTPPVDYFSYTTASAIANLTPEGKPRVNLRLLKAYVDGLAVDQTAGNARAALVDRLLDPNEEGTDWGENNQPGGNLSILTKLGHYTPTQAKQIVANLLDYIDADLLPTADNVDAPTYFGVEGRADANGNVVGHPYINFVGTGLVFNRSNGAATMGGLNSTRVLVVLGIVNPWSSSTKDWSVFYVKPEIEIAITGDASGGNLGPHAQDYFHTQFTTSDNSNQLTTVPAGAENIAPNTGYSFPSPDSSATNYANQYDILNTEGRQPAGMVFSNLGFKITRLRLKFIDTDGRFGYVQILDGLELKAVPVPPGASQPANPSTVDLDHSGSPSSLVYKFASGAPNKEDFHLNSDPRISFNAGTWLLSKSTEHGAAPPDPQTAINIFGTADPSDWDFTGAAPSSTNHLWYTKPDVTSDFYVKSPSMAPPPGGLTLDSSGELGYLHTGIPWETLRFYFTGTEQTGKERDRELLAYVQSGTFPLADYGNVPTAAGAGNPPNQIPLLDGPLNLNTNKLPTLESLFLGATAKLDADATARADGSQADPDVANLAGGVKNNAGNALLPLPGDFLTLPPIMAVTQAAGPADFDREILARRIANVTGTQSTRFTVYSLGEARDNSTTTSRVNLRAEVEMRTDASGHPVPTVLNKAYYLAN